MSFPQPLTVQTGQIHMIFFAVRLDIRVHLRAKRLDMKGIPRDELPKLGELMPKVYLLIPLVTLVVIIMNGMTMARSAIIATLLCIVVSMFNKDNRMNVAGFFKALATGAQNCLSIGIACGVAGIIAP